MGELQDSKSQQSAGSSQTSKPTIIGRSLVIKGELTASEDLVIHGRFEGSIKLDGDKITVTGQGRVQGDISARSIQIEGSVEGNITGHERLEVGSTGRVRGDVRAPRVVLVEGCSYQGQVDTSQPEPATVEKTEVVANRGLSQTA